MNYVIAACFGVAAVAVGAWLFPFDALGTSLAQVTLGTIVRIFMACYVWAAGLGIAIKIAVDT